MGNSARKAFRKRRGIPQNPEFDRWYRFVADHFKAYPVHALFAQPIRIGSILRPGSEHPTDTLRLPTPARYEYVTMIVDDTPDGNIFGMYLAARPTGFTFSAVIDKVKMDQLIGSVRGLPLKMAGAELVHRVFRAAFVISFKTQEDVDAVLRQHPEFKKVSSALAVLTPDLVFAYDTVILTEPIGEELGVKIGPAP